MCVDGKFRTFRYQNIHVMGFHINDKKTKIKATKKGKAAAAAPKTMGNQATGGGKKMIKTGGTRGS